MYARLSIAAPLLFAALASPLQAQRVLPDLEPTRFDGERVIGYAKPCDLIRVPVEIGGRSVDFLLDTGFSFNAVDTRFRDQCCGPKRLVNIENSLGTGVSLESFASCEATVAAEPCRLEPALVWESKLISDWIGGDISGILGGSYLTSDAVGYRRFDHAVYLGRSSVRTFDRKYAIDITRRNLLYTEDVRVAGIAIRCQIDTGARWLSIEHREFTRLTSAGAIRDVETQPVAAFNTVGQTRSGVLNSANIWGAGFRDIAVLEDVESRIGLELLTSFDFRIDYAAETIEVTEGPTANRATRYDRSGLEFRDRGGRVVIESVAEDSPASEAGLQPDDVVAEVYGGELVGRDLHALRYILTDPGRESVDLTIERDGERSARRLTLR